MTESDAYVIRENPSHHMDSSELRTSIQNIMASEGLKVPSYMCTNDSSQAYLPPMKIETEKNIVYKKKIAELGDQDTGSLKIDGGASGLFERADANGDNRLTRDEISARFGTKLSQDEARALKDIYGSFSSMDWDGNGRVSLNDIEGRQRRERQEEQLNDRLDSFRRIVATHRHDIDRNGDGRISAGELAQAGRSESEFNTEDRQTINWIRHRS